SMSPEGRRLLEGNGCASLFENSLCLLGGFLVCTLEDVARSAIDDGLGLAETQRGELANGLDDLDLLVADRLENDVEGVLLFDLFCSSTGSSRSSNSDGCSRGDLEGLLECLDELAEFDEREALELLKQLF